MRLYVLLICVVAALATAAVFASTALAVEEGEGGGSETITCSYHHSEQQGNYDVHIYRYFYTRSQVWGGECRREYSPHEFSA